VLAAVQTGLNSAEAHPPEAKRPARGASAPTGAVVELLKVLLKARAEDAKVASKLIATVSDLEKIAADDEGDTPALHGWRRETFGEDALKLKRGEIALVLDGGKVRVVEVRRRLRDAPA
jgi:ribonuclease D